MGKKLKRETGELHETISKRLRPLKAIVKVLGVILVYFGFLLIVLSYAINYLIKNLPDPVTIFLVVFAVGWLFFGGGLGVCAGVSILTLPNEEKMSHQLEEYYKSKEKPMISVQFFSLRWNRIIAAALFLILGFLDLFIITGTIGHHNTPFGNAVFLGGPSFYYLVGFFPQGFGIGLLLYVFFYSHKAHIASSENYFYYNMFKKNSTVHTTLPKKEIEMIRYQNNHINKNYTWIIILVPFIVLTAIQGVYLLTAPMLTNPIQGILFLVTAVLETIALFYLALRPSNYIKITTKENNYETWFVPHKFQLTKLPIAEADGKERKDSAFMASNNISSIHRNYRRLLLGLFFSISGLIMLIFYYAVGVFGNLYTMGSIIFGVLLIVKAVANDFSDNNGVAIDYDIEKRALSFKQTYRSRFVRIDTLQETDLKVVGQFQKISVFELLLIPILLTFSTIQTVQSWVLSSSPAVISNSVITTIFLTFIYLLIFLYVCSPTDHLEVRTPTFEYFIPITLTSGKNGVLKGVLSSDLKKGFWFRSILILVTGFCALLGVLLYLQPFFFV